MEKLKQKLYRSLRMQSIYRRVNTISVTIGAMAMVVLTVICIFTYISSTLELLRERESRYLSIYRYHGRISHRNNRSQMPAPLLSGLQQTLRSP